MGVLPLPPGYDVQKQVATNAIKKQISAYWWVLVIAAGVLAAMMYFGWRIARRAWAR
jgi:heme/copper-type cytochrome/quinol oxidase subunit 2